MKIAYIDEAVFSFSTMKTKAWSASYSSITVNEASMKMKAIALVAAISEDVGYELHLTNLKSISTLEYVEFLKKLSKKFQNQPFALFMDNLAVHKSEDAKEAYKKYKIMPIYNMPYSPQYNGIESYFSLVKAEYKNLLLKHIVNDLDFDSLKLINTSIKAVSNDKAKACARNGREAVIK